MHRLCNSLFASTCFLVVNVTMKSPVFGHRCWLDGMQKAKEDEAVQQRLRQGIQYTDEMQELLRREV